MDKYLHNIDSVAHTYHGFTLEPTDIFEIPQTLQLKFATYTNLITDILDGKIAVSIDGINPAGNPEACLSLFLARNTFRSTFAVDKNNIDQDVIGTDVAIITPERVLWDSNGDFNLTSGKFVPPVNGVWNLNGTIAITPSSSVSRVLLHIYRNNELWFTVSSIKTPIPSVKNYMVFSCDVDGYATDGHEFDIRIELTGTLPTAVISGSDEETAWGMTFLTTLHGISPT